MMGRVRSGRGFLSGRGFFLCTWIYLEFTNKWASSFISCWFYYSHEWDNLQVLTCQTNVIFNLSKQDDDWIPHLRQHHYTWWSLKNWKPFRHPRGLIHENLATRFLLRGTSRRMAPKLFWSNPRVSSAEFLDQRKMNVFMINLPWFSMLLDLHKILSLMNPSSWLYAEFSVETFRPTKWSYLN